MPRPCQRDHPLRPETCRVCHWYAQPTEAGAFHRRLWGEPSPVARAGSTDVVGGVGREIVPGLADPLPGDELRPLPQGWPFDEAVIERHRAALFRLAREEMPQPGIRSGEGVLLIGGGKFWPGIVVSVKMLRDAGSTLPVQIWHRGEHEPIRHADLAGVDGVTIHDLTTITPEPRILRPWESKTLALLASGWQRIFFLDADAYVVRDPAPVLERLSAEEPFLYWHDGPHAPVRWSTWGLEGSSVPAIQGGHFAIHMNHAWREFVIAHWINQHSDFTYAHQYGDQDSWRVALTVTGGAHACLGPARWDEVAYVCNVAEGPLIVHRCRAKMFLAEDVPPGDTWCNRRVAHLPGEARAWGHFDGLR